MHPSIPGLILEFEVIVARAARTGVLPVDDVVQTYAELARLRPHSEQARCINLSGIVRALQVLPRQIWQANMVLLVPRLSAYPHLTHQIAHSPHAFACAALADTTLLCEAPYGRASLYDYAHYLALALCEAHKAQNLLAQAASASSPSPKPPSPSPPDLAMLAFAWGHDAATLQRCVSQAGEGLLSFLQAPSPAPKLHVHHSFAPMARHKHATECGDSLIRLVAEAGLADRPMHVLAGDLNVLDCVSPYARELRAPLLAWGAAHSATWAHAAASSCVGDDPVYAILRAFLPTDGRLGPEKAAAERSVGIHQYALGAGGPTDRAFSWQLTLIDTARLDARLCDPRLGAFRVRTPAPVIICLQAVDPCQLGILLDHLVRTFAERLASIFIADKSYVPAAPSGHVIVASRFENMTGGPPVALPAGALLPEDLSGLLSQPPSYGVLYSAPCLALAQHMDVGSDLPANPEALCWTANATSAVDAILQAGVRGLLSPQTELGWAAVNAFVAPLVLAALHQSQTAMALARLRRILLQPEPRAATTRRGATAWPARLKA